MSPPAIRPLRRTPAWLLTLLGWLLFGYVLAVVCVALADLLGPERFWWSGLNLYLPQWIWAVPALALLPASLVLSPRLACIPLGCALWVAWQPMGFCWHSRPAPPAAGELRIRVMTYNVKYYHGGVPAICAEINRAEPDLLLLQDAEGINHYDLFAALGGRQVRAIGQYVVASRLPLGDVQIVPMPDSPTSDDTGWDYLRVKVQCGQRSITVYDVHLLTPRHGLNSVRKEREEGLLDLHQNVYFRLYEASAVAQAAGRESGPVLLAGDLNAPPASMVCRGFRAAGLHDAFEQAGRGYGYTYGHSLRLHQDYMRIDHIFLSRQLRALRCWAGGTEGSAHRPVVADLAFRPDADRGTALAARSR